METRFDYRGNLSYRCKCGRQVKVPASDLVIGRKIYCGCGQVELILGKNTVNENRRAAGLPDLVE